MNCLACAGCFVRLDKCNSMQAALVSIQPSAQAKQPSEQPTRWPPRLPSKKPPVMQKPSRQPSRQESRQLLVKQPPLMQPPGQPPCRQPLLRQPTTAKAAQATDIGQASVDSANAAKMDTEASQIDSLEVATEAANAAGANAEAAAAALLDSVASRDMAQGKWGTHFLQYPGAEPGEAPSIPHAEPESAEPDPGRSCLQAEEAEAWWSRLGGSRGQIWRVRPDCKTHVLAVTREPLPSSFSVRLLSRGDRCIQAGPPTALLVQASNGATLHLRMLIKPTGWITLATRGADNYEFLVMEDEVEPEDRIIGGLGVAKPGTADAVDGQVSHEKWRPERPDCCARGHGLLPWELPASWKESCAFCRSFLRCRSFQCFRCNIFICSSCKLEAEGPFLQAPRAPLMDTAAPVVPKDASNASCVPVCSSGTSTGCWLTGNDVCWPATDGACNICKKPLTSHGTGCCQCQVQCCSDSSLPHTCMLSTHKEGQCCFCQQPVIPGTEHILACTLVCETCVAAAAQQATEAVVATYHARHATSQADRDSSKRRADVAFVPHISQPEPVTAAALQAALQAAAAVARAGTDLGKDDSAEHSSLHSVSPLSRPAKVPRLVLLPEPPQSPAPPLPAPATVCAPCLPAPTVVPGDIFPPPVLKMLADAGACLEAVQLLQLLHQHSESGRKQCNQIA
jgi:hypothetical protein